MSKPRKYGGPKEYSREQLETWINQVEDLSGCAISIHVNKVSKLTILTVDLDVKKPGPAKVLMGHHSGEKAFKGRAYVMGQETDVTVHR